MKVAIVGCAQTQYKSREIDLAADHMIFQTASQLLKETGLSIHDIGSVVYCASDYWDGELICDVQYAEAWGGDIVKEQVRLTADGLYGVVMAYAQILSGLCDAIIVGAHTLGSRSAPHSIMVHAFDPHYLRPILSEIPALALQARCYMQKYGIKEEQAAKVAVKNRKNAVKNPYAQVREEISVDDIFASNALSTPLKELDCPPDITDGCCAVLLASEKKAKQLTDIPVWIEGLGYYADSHHLGFRNLADLDTCYAAAKRAYEMAGITNPRKEISIAEVSDVTSFHELMLYEALGFCSPGDGGKLIDAGVTELSGELPVNPSGGVLSGNPYMARGLIRLAEAYLQLSGKAEGRQVANCSTAVVHGAQGACLQSNCVVVIKK